MYRMIDHIHEEPDALAKTLTGSDAGLAYLRTGFLSGQWRRLVIVGVGSSYTASLMALPAFRIHSAPACSVLTSTELTHYADAWLGPETVVLSVSRSGERGWVVEAQEDASARGAFTVAMTGVGDGLLAQSADLVLLTAEGPEVSFPKTKSVVACAGLLMKLALSLAPEGDTLAVQRLDALARIPERLRRSIELAEPVISEFASQLPEIGFVSLCGSGGNYGAAVEGAIKIHETTYVPTKADDTGNCLHGVLGTADRHWLQIALMTDRDRVLTGQVLNLAGEVGARRLLITDARLADEAWADCSVTVGDAGDAMLSSLVLVAPLQLLTYYLAIVRGRNPDFPDYMKLQLAAMLPLGREEPEMRTAAALRPSNPGE